MALLLMSCSNEEFNIENTHRKIDEISEIVDSITFVPLETTEQSLLTSISKVKMHDREYYMLDSKQNIIFVFSKNGDYLRQLNRVGKGEGEYLNIKDFNFFDNHLEVLALNRILVFDLDFSYIRSIDLPYITHFFQRLDENNIALYHLASDYRVSLYNLKEAKIIYRLEENYSFSRMLPVNPWNSPFYSFDDNVCFKSTFTNSIIELSNKEYTITHTFFKKHPFNIKKMPIGESSDFYIKEFAKSKSPYILSGASYPKYSRCLVFENKNKYNIFTKSNGEKLYFNSLQGDLKFGVISYESDKAYYELSNKEARKFLSVQDKIKVKILNQDRFDRSSISDNPILTIYHFD